MQPLETNLTYADQIIVRDTQEECAKKTALGFPDVDYVYAPGHKLAASGEHALQLSRQSWEKSPLVCELAELAKAHIKAEEREDLIAPLAEIRMDDLGRISRGKGKLSLERPAAAQLLTALLPDGSRGCGYLLGCPPGLRADNVNYWREEQARRAVEAQASRPAGKARLADFLDKTVLLRTRKQRPGAARSVFAALGEHYPRVDADKLAAVVGEECNGKGARGAYTYDGLKSRLDAIWHLPEAAFSGMRVGKSYKAGVTVRGEDSGRGCVTVQAVVWDAVCVNLTTVEREIDVASLVHKGKAEDILAEVRKAIRQAEDRIHDFVDVWAEAERHAVVGESWHRGDIEPVFARLLEKDLIPTPVGMDQKSMLLRLRRAYWSRDVAPTVKGIADAVTQIAHADAWKSPWATDDLQTAAGSLVWNHVQVVQVAEGALFSAKQQGWQPGRFTLNDPAILQTPAFQFVRLDA
jgi:hypothetical protein